MVIFTCLGFGGASLGQGEEASLNFPKHWNINISIIFFHFLWVFFSFIFISWRLITLQYCSGFCHTLTWISHGFTQHQHYNLTKKTQLDKKMLAHYRSPTHSLAVNPLHCHVMWPKYHSGLQTSFWSFCGCCLVTKLWLICYPMNCSPPDSSGHGICQARILECVAVSFFWGPFQSRDHTHISCTGRQILYHWTPREAHLGQVPKARSVLVIYGSTLSGISCNWAKREHHHLLWALLQHVVLDLPRCITTYLMPVLSATIPLSLHLHICFHLVEEVRFGHCSGLDCW